MNVCIESVQISKFVLRVQCSLRVLWVRCLCLFLYCFVKKTICIADPIDYFILFDVKKNSVKDSESENIFSFLICQAKKFYTCISQWERYFIYCFMFIIRQRFRCFYFNWIKRIKKLSNKRFSKNNTRIKKCESKSNC